MTDFFSKMDEDYAQKHFLNGSVFEGATKTVKRRGKVGVVIIGVWLIAALYGLVWAVGRLREFLSDGQDDMLGVGIVICAFFGLLVLVFGILILFMIKGIRQKREDYIRDSAKKSKLPVSEIEAFERQAVASDCYILELTAGLDRVLSNATNKDGLLTRDYIYLADPSQTVMRVEDVRACCFSDYTYYINIGNRSKKIHCLAIYLIASNGVSVLSDTTKEAGQALMAILKERNNTIDTNDGKVLPEGELDAYKKRILGA